jgi:hypothetical protein
MAVQIIDDSSCIKIVTNGDAIHINKKLVKTIDILQNDTVRINIGEGTLHHLYIKLADVNQPAGMTDVQMLRDVIKHMLDADDGVADPTLENQVAELNLITQIEATQETHTGILTTVKDLLGFIRTLVNPVNTVAITVPSRIDESTPEKVYYGFAYAGASPSEAVWAIKLTARIGGVTVSRWAGGDMNFTHVWNDRATLAYLPALT